MNWRGAVNKNINVQNVGYIFPSLYCIASSSSKKKLHLYCIVLSCYFFLCKSFVFCSINVNNLQILEANFLNRSVSLAAMDCASEDCSDNSQRPDSHKDQRVYFVPHRSFLFQDSTHFSLLFISRVFELSLNLWFHLLTVNRKRRN